MKMKTELEPESTADANPPQEMRVMRLDEPCGCGRKVRYQVSKDGTMACNKYRRCLTYEELEKALQKATSLILAYRKKREHDGLNGRHWNAEKHFEAEALIERLEKNT